MSNQELIQSSTRSLNPEISNLLNTLKMGQRIRVTLKLRVGSTATWMAPIEGTFRHYNFLSTGIATDRIPEDDIVVVCVHFTKDNGELSSFTVDDDTKIEKL
ncbi:MAG: hypothetical protein EBT92_00210 [Planctomycetes bacterium]|nr:hypothetical protein [Planctomycetota bacterium]NBY03533.1 hypothetical protein [Planctomycetota bacterium]